MKFAKLLIALFSSLGVLALCCSAIVGTTTAADTPENPYFDVQKADPLGNKSIAVIGDSISHGANCPTIYEQSYIAKIKAAMWEQTSCENYGFASIENTMWNSLGSYNEVHQARWGSEWTEQRKNDNLGRFNLSASRQGTRLYVTVSKTFAYFTVYYEVNATGGTFDVITKDGTWTVDTTQGYAGKIGRSDYIPFPSDKKITLEVASSGKTVAFNGIGYYQDVDGVVINNYASNGSKLIDVDDSILDFVCSADTLIMAHGYNDSHFQSTVAANRTAFTAKINYIISKVKETGCKVIVNDMCWNCGQNDFFRTELKRLASETGGVYASTQDVYDAAIIDTLQDGVHPSVAGHKMVADVVLAAMTGDTPPTLATTTTTQAPPKDGFQPIWSAPLTDTSGWLQKDGGTGALLPYPDTTNPILNLTVGENGMSFVRTAAAPNAWPDTRTYINGRYDLSNAYLYYDIDAQCSWNISVSFGSNRDTYVDAEVIKLGTYIAAQHNLNIGYDADVPAGHYTGTLKLADAIENAQTIGRLLESAVTDLSDTYMGRLHLWHVGGTVGSSKITLSELFVGVPEEVTTTTEEPTTTTTEAPQPTVPGDLNGDDVVNMDDAFALFRAVSGQTTLSDGQAAVSDLSGDGVINIIDAFMLYRQVAGNA
ncbi:MAG: hypothetical protein IJU16_01000 [Clostridia bacterium]|nr:hypothetical protein [Clostridia bacterium]